jgi:surface polysaccharide O-acyltransferase-like enzyme
MQRDRDISFDALRGVAIIAVIAIHTSATGFSCRYSATGWWNFPFLIAYRQLLNFAVPAFIFISGYWSSKKPMKLFRDYKTFLIRRLTRVLIPYLFWSFILLGYEAINLHNVNVYRVILKLLTGSACPGYFFIVVIAQLYIITPLLNYINRHRYGSILVLIFNLVSLLALYLSRVFNIIGHLPAALPFYSWIIFYELGLLVGNCSDKTFAPQNLRFLILPIFLVSLLASELEGMIILLKYDNLDFAVSAVKYSSFFYSICIILGFLFVRERIRYWPKSLVLIGNYSFGIYLIHMPILNQVANLVQKSSTIYSFQPLYQFITIILSMLTCLVIIYIMRMLLPQPFCVKVLGF